MTRAFKEDTSFPAPLYGAVEAGGTKFVCAIGTSQDDIRHKATFPTETPEKTLAAATDFFRQNAGESPITALGVGSFGPVDIDLGSPTWGQILETPKAGWSGVPIARIFEREVGVPVRFDTDVNCALLGEAEFGAGRGLKDFVYITVGTGIGGGIMTDGRVVHGAMHPELGHMLVPREQDEDPAFAGVCAFHGSACLEGLASGPAIAARWGKPAQSLPEDHPAWALQAGYLASLCVNLSLTLSTRKIIFGGGVMQQAHLFPMIRSAFTRKLAGYLQSGQATAHVDDFIVPAMLGQTAGITGALLLAQKG